MQIKLEIDITDGAGHAQILRPLDCGEDAVHLLPQRLFQEGGGFGRQDCAAPILRQRREGRRYAVFRIAVADGLGAGVDTFGQPLGDGAQKCGADHIGIGIHAGHAMFDPP